MAGRDIIVIGASAGGVEALTKLASLLPATLPSSVFVVVHTDPSGPHLLPRILARSGPLPAVSAGDRESFQPGTIYVARPDYHLLVHKGQTRLFRGPRENLHRPAIDTLFRSAATQYGSRVIGVILTGNLDDGTAGLLAIKRCGGLAVVQDPEEAPFPSMPSNAIRRVDIDYVRPLAAIGPLLYELSRTSVATANPGGPNPGNRSKQRDSECQEEEKLVASTEQELDSPASGLTCPECQGALWEISADRVLSFRCRVGHRFSTETLIQAQGEAVERALWSALRALEEGAAAGRRLALDADERGHVGLAARYIERASGKEKDAEVIRELLLHSKRQAFADADVMDIE